MNSSAIPQAPESWNRYTYAANDPVGEVDPSGLLLTPGGGPGGITGGGCDGGIVGDLGGFFGVGDWFFAPGGPSQGPSCDPLIPIFGPNGSGPGGNGSGSTGTGSGPSDPLAVPTCFIYVSYVNVGIIPLSRHLFILTRTEYSDGWKGSYWEYRAGPQDFIAGKPQILQAEGRPYENASDQAGPNPPVALTFSEPGTCSGVNDALKKFNSEVNNANIQYDWRTTNSNAYVYTALVQALNLKPPPDIHDGGITPGWGILLQLSARAK